MDFLIYGKSGEIFMLQNSSTQKQSSTQQNVKSNNSLKNVNRIFGHSKWVRLQLNCLLGNYKLDCLNSSWSDAQEKNWQKRNEAKHNCFDGFCEYKYCMVDWSIITELQIQYILTKCQWLYIPKWLHFIFLPVSKCWKKLHFCQENGSASWLLQHSFYHW